MSPQDTLKMRRGQGLLATVIDNPRVTLELGGISVANECPSTGNRVSCISELLTSPCRLKLLTFDDLQYPQSGLEVRGEKYTGESHLKFLCYKKHLWV